MKSARILTVANCLLLFIIFFNVLTWALTGNGVNYLSRLSSVSKYIFYALLLASIIYSMFISYLLFASKKSGVALMVVWDIFLGLFVLIPWVGGYAMLKYSYGEQADIGFLSASNLLKGTVGISLILFGLAFKNQRNQLR